MPSQPVPARMQVFFTDNEGYGWNEQYWYSGSTDPLTTFQQNLRNFLNQRLALMVEDSGVRWIRVQSAFKRDPFIFDYQGLPNTNGTRTGTVNNVSNRLLLRLESTGIGYNKVFLGGIDDVLIQGNQFVADPAFTAAFDTWRTAMVGFSNFQVTASVDNPLNPVKITLAQRGSPKGILLTPKPPDTLTLGTKYRIKGASQLGYNGVKTVVLAPPDTDPGVYQMSGARPQTDNPVGDNVTATPIVPGSGPITAFFIEGFSQRNPGRPFGFVRGRRPTLFSQRP